MPERLLVDTDVLVAYLRGASEAVAFLENAREALLLSTITVAEIYAGVREGKERRALEAFVAAFELMPVDRAVAEKGWALPP